MSIGNLNPNEFSLTPQMRAEVKEGLFSVELLPKQMLEVAKGIAEGAKLIGTNLTVHIGEKKTNPRLFSYDFEAMVLQDDHEHTGYAKIFVPTEGARHMLDECGERDFLCSLVSQWLKLERKGQEALRAEETGGIVASKAGKLNEHDKALLSDAQLAMIETTVSYIAAHKAGVNEYSQVDSFASNAVAEWIGGGCSDEDAKAVVHTIATSIASVLSGITQER